MSNIKKEELINALDNENNESIMELDNEKISKEKNDILQNLHIPKTEIKILHKKLKSYRLVNNISDIVIGNYMRWINISKPKYSELKLTNGGIILEIKDFKDTFLIVCKNNMNRVFQIDFNKNIIFQKINPQEKIILTVLNYLNKNK